MFWKSKENATIILLSCVDGRGGNGVHLKKIRRAFRKTGEKVNIVQYFQVTGIGGAAVLDPNMGKKEQAEGIISTILNLSEMRIGKLIIIIAAHNMGCKGLHAGGVDIDWQLKNPYLTRRLQIEQMRSAANTLRVRFEEAEKSLENIKFKGVYRTGRKPNNQQIGFEFSKLINL